MLFEAKLLDPVGPNRAEQILLRAARRHPPEISVPLTALVCIDRIGEALLHIVRRGGWRTWT
jgi:hypothetical protein